MDSIHTSKSVDGQYPGSKLPDPQGALSKQIPSSAISAVNSEVAVLQPSAGAKVGGTYLKMSAKKAEIRKRAAEPGVLATIQYYATKLPVNLCALVTQVCPAHKFHSTWVRRI